MHEFINPGVGLDLREETRLQQKYSSEGGCEINREGRNAEGCRHHGVTKKIPWEKAI